MEALAARHPKLWLLLEIVQKWDLQAHQEDVDPPEMEVQDAVGHQGMNLPEDEDTKQHWLRM